MSRVTVEQLKAALRGRWRSVLSRLGVPCAEWISKAEGPCPRCAGDARFRAYNDFDETGGARCNRCGEWADGIATLMWWQNIDFPAAIDILAAEAGLNGEATWEPFRVVHPPAEPEEKPGPRRGTPATLHRGYEAVLNALALNHRHRKDLRARGLDDDDIDAAGYRSLPRDGRNELAAKLQADLGDDYELIPGLTRDKVNPIPVQPGLVVPCRDLEGKIIGLRVRRDGNIKKGQSKYTWFSSSKHGGPSSVAVPHAPRFSGDTSTVRIAEGELKAELATKFTGIFSLSFPGNQTWDRTIPFIEQLGAKTVLLAFDADAEQNLGVARTLKAAYQQLTERGYDVKVETWALADGKGIDDLLVAGKTPTVLAGDLALNEVARIVQAATPPPDEPPPDEGEASPSDVEDKPTVRNAWVEWAKDSNGESKAIVTPIPMRDVISLVQRATSNWPRRVDQALFIHDADLGVSWLTMPAAFFGWLSSTAGIVDWHRGRGCVSKEELFQELKRTAFRHAAVEQLPHEPRIDGHYYACPDVAPGDGSKLRELLDFFCPATPIDRDLILAAMMTCFWGGQSGKRPVFVITTDDGPGAGKSTVAQIIGMLAGGLMSFDRDEEVSQIKTRLLSPDALTRRCAILDNVKTLKLSWAELEGLITAESISGKVMYVGEGSRPNTITWFITLNGANLGTDIAKRSVIIKVRKPEYAGDWEVQVRAFIQEHREALIADVISALKAEPADLEKYTRWATWEEAVLRRLPEPADAQQLIIERQSVADAEQEENEAIEEHIAEHLQRLDYSAEHQNVFLPLKVITPWFNEAAGSKYSTTQVARLLRRMCSEGRLRRLIESPSRTYGRGFVWYGLKAGDAELQTDIELRHDGNGSQRSFI